MRISIPLLALSLSSLLLLGCPDDGPADDGDGGSGGTAGDAGTAGTGGGTAGTGGGTAGTGGNGTGGTGGTVGDACGAGTECDSLDGDSGEWCIENVCGAPGDANLDYAFCNDSPDNPNADGEFACGCLVGACSRTVENNCFAPTDCTPGPEADAFCWSVCETECGGPDAWRDGFCAQTGPESGFCECLCADGTGTCFE